jgi:hypothetical protein
MTASKIKYVLVITFIGSLLLFFVSSASSQTKSDSPTISELRQAKKEQGLSGPFFQDSTSKNWFLEDQEGNSYKFDESTKKWRKIGETSSSAATPGLKNDYQRPGQGSLILDKYYVAVKTLKLFQQPERGAREVGTLEFRTKVEKLAENEDGWMQVRQRETNLTGWVYRPRWNLEKYQLERPHMGGGKKKASQPQPKEEAKPEAKPEPM